jgi:hypothetical protein
MAAHCSAWVALRNVGASPLLEAECCMVDRGEIAALAPVFQGRNGTAGVASSLG